MTGNEQKINISVEYTDDKKARERFVKFIIDCLLEGELLPGDDGSAELT